MWRHCKHPSWFAFTCLCVLRCRFLERRLDICGRNVFICPHLSTGSHERTGWQGRGDQVSTGEGREPPAGEPSSQTDHRGRADWRLQHFLMANKIIHLNFKATFLWIKYKKSWNYYLRNSAHKKDISVIIYLRSYCSKPVGEVEHKWRRLAEGSRCSFPDNEREWEGYMMKVVMVRQTSCTLFCKSSKIIFPFCSSHIYTYRRHGPYQNIPHLWYIFMVFFFVFFFFWSLTASIFIQDHCM